MWATIPPFPLARPLILLTGILIRKTRLLTLKEVMWDLTPAPMCPLQLEQARSMHYPLLRECRDPENLLMVRRLVLALLVRLDLPILLLLILREMALARAEVIEVDLAMVGVVDLILVPLMDVLDLVERLVIGLVGVVVLLVVVLEVLIRGLLVGMVLRPLRPSLLSTCRHLFQAAWTS